MDTVYPTDGVKVSEVVRRELTKTLRDGVRVAESVHAPANMVTKLDGVRVAEAVGKTPKGRVEGGRVAEQVTASVSSTRSYVKPREVVTIEMTKSVKGR